MELLLPGKVSFRGGIHPPNNKALSKESGIEQSPEPDTVFIPISMHIGAPAEPCVKKGDEVKRYQTIGTPKGFVSAGIHSPVSGKIKSIKSMLHPLGDKVTTIEIENDREYQEAELSPFRGSIDETASAGLVQYIAEAGIVGMGGASFPTHVKLSPPSNKPVDTLIINGAECEPFLTADYRIMIEEAEKLISGTRVIKKVLNAENCIIAVEDNKPDAIEKISGVLEEKKISDIEVISCRTKYPQGGEKQLINAVTKREVPSGGLPMDVGCVVQNTGTVCAVYDAVYKGIPLVERIVSVTGPCVSKPSNFRTMIGTPVSVLLNAAEADMDKTVKLLSGGPMMGLAQGSTEVPVIKATSGILCLNELPPSEKERPCINCGRCVSVCPIGLVPSKIAKLVSTGYYEDSGGWDIKDCMECGSCAYVCPSKINLVQWMKLGKLELSAIENKEKN